ncbi:beta-1,3-galactosyltransferase 1-like isoform 1-T2 [Anableps anableps]
MESSDRPAENRRCFGFSRRHSLFLLLVLGVVLFFYCAGIWDSGNEWDPKQWMENHSTKLFVVFGKQGTASNETKQTGGFPHGATAAELPRHASVTPPPAPRTQRSGVSWRGTESTLDRRTPRQTAAPYVSPGPYLVEYPYEYHLDINEQLKCEQEKPFVVLVVQVAPRNRAHRDTIRSTWGSEKLVGGQVVTLLFLLGRQAGDDAQQVRQQLLQESAEHHDLLQGDFVDCYKNLTIKTMVMLEWLSSYCSGAAYAMKIDSDMFLNVPNLVALLLGAPRADYMTGLVAHGGAVLRDPNSKWFLPVEVFSETVYPPYALGLGYVLSLDLAKKLLGASRHVKALYIEDVYLGLCMRHLGIHPTDPPSWSSFNVFPVSYSRCAFSKIIATTTQESTDRVQMWRDFKRPGRYC